MQHWSKYGGRGHWTVHDECVCGLNDILVRVCTVAYAALEQKHYLRLAYVTCRPKYIMVNYNLLLKKF